MGCVGFLVEGTVACVFWWVRLDLVFLVGRNESDGVFWGVCELMFLAASLLMGGIVFLSC